MDTITSTQLSAAAKDAVLRSLQTLDRVRNNGHDILPARRVNRAVWETLFGNADPFSRTPDQHDVWTQALRFALAEIGFNVDDTREADGERVYYADAEETTDADAAFEHRGSQAAVWAPRYGQAHQQYFSPRWAAEAFADVADRLFNVTRTYRVEPGGKVDTGPSPRLAVLDPTCGSGRLLAPFAQRGHHVLGIELDERLVPVARRAVGKENVRHGDVCAYGAVLPENAYNAAVINPPYGLWWPVEEGGYLARYELAGAQSIESQNMALELVTGALRNADGLLMALLSGRFFEVYPKAFDYLKRNYQLVASLTLPKPYKPEYGIDVDAALVVAYRAYQYSDKIPAPLTGTWEGTDTDDLVQAVVESFEAVQRQQYSRYRGSHLSAGYHRRLPEVPELDMTVQVDTSAPAVRLTKKGLRRNGSDWSAAWLTFYQGLPLAAYSAAEGAMTDVANAYGSLPNVLMAGSERSRERLKTLGFEVELTPHDRAQIAVAAKRYARQRVPIRPLKPMEFLAYYEDGPITARADVVVPHAGPDGEDYSVVEGATYELRARWKRVDQIVRSEPVEAKKAYIQHTHIDRGYMVFRFADDDGGTFTVEEVNAGQVAAMVDAFGLPEVEIVDDLPDFCRWAAEVDRAIETQAAINTGLRPYPSQRQDIIRFCTKGQIVNLWEMGGGKTMAVAFWATVRGYERQLFITPPSVVDDLLKDLTRWGFDPQRLSHAEVSRIKAQKRARSAFFRRRKDAKARRASLRLKLARLDERLAAGEPLALGGRGPADNLDLTCQRRNRLRAEAASLEEVLSQFDQRGQLLEERARKRRHLRNLRDVKAKDKATDNIDAEIAETEARIAALDEQLSQLPALPERPSGLYVTSYTDLSLGDHVGVFDEWSCEHYDEEGNLESIVTNTGARCDACGRARKQVVKACPRCGTRWRGEGQGGGRVCRECGYVAWTLGVSRYHLPAPAYADRQTGDADGERVRSPHGFPLAPRMKKLWSAVAIDEAQDAKGKTTLRAAATRGLRANGKALLTGTWIKGFITDLFWSAGWLMGFGSPMWPFPYRGGSARFVEQFGTFEYITKEFADSLQTGRRRMIPSVSNLNRLWRLIGQVAIRREKEHFLKDLPAKHVEVHWLQPTDRHARLVNEVSGAMKDVLAAELRKSKPSMGRIGMALWWGRYVASCPTLEGCAHYAGAYGHSINVAKASMTEIKAVQDLMALEGKLLTGHEAFTFNKVAKAIKIIKAAQAAGDKVLLFTSLTRLYDVLGRALDREGIPWVGVKGTTTRNRRRKVDAFEDGDAVVLLAGTGQLNRGVTITAANHVVIMNTEWSPEVTLQAEDRVHRPGQRKEVHVHYLLSRGTVDEDMWELIMQKWAAQRAVQDREAQFKSVEEILAEAALSNAQLAVARSVVEREVRVEVESGPTEAEAETVEAEIEDGLVFGRASGLRPTRARRPAKQLVPVQQLSLFG